MSNELRYMGKVGDTGKTVLIRIYTLAGVQVGADVPLTEVGTDGRYYGDMPTTPDGSYDFRYIVDGESDGVISAYWDGTYLQAVSGPTVSEIAQAIANAGTPIKVISSLLGSELEMHTHETLKFDVLGIIPADVDNVIFTVKLRATDSDADALIQVDSTTGLLVINQVAATATDGSVTVDQPNGKASIVVSDDAMATLGAYLRNEVCWNAKWITASGESGSIKRGTGTIPHSITQTI